MIFERTHRAYPNTGEGNQPVKFKVCFVGRRIRRNAKCILLVMIHHWRPFYCDTQAITNKGSKTNY